MTQTRIEQLIDELYAFVSECKASPLSQSKLIVPRDQLFDLIEELKRRTPEELRRYQKIIINRESIIKQAEEQAEQIIENARVEAARLLDETSIMQQALARANGIIDNARTQSEALTADANDKSEKIKLGLLTYSNEILQNVEETLTGMYNAVKNKSADMISLLEENLNQIAQNRKELTRSLVSSDGDEDEAAEDNSAAKYHDEHGDDLDVDPADLLDD